jgi:hypothetical protein
LLSRVDSGSVEETFGQIYGQESSPTPLAADGQDLNFNGSIDSLNAASTTGDHTLEPVSEAAKRGRVVLGERSAHPGLRRVHGAAVARHGLADMGLADMGLADWKRRLVQGDWVAAIQPRRSRTRRLAWPIWDGRHGLADMGWQTWGGGRGIWAIPSRRQRRRRLTTDSSKRRVSATHN